MTDIDIKEIKRLHSLNMLTHSDQVSLAKLSAIYIKDFTVCATCADSLREAFKRLIALAEEAKWENADKEAQEFIDNKPLFPAEKTIEIEISNCKDCPGGGGRYTLNGPASETPSLYWRHHKLALPEKGQASV